MGGLNWGMSLLIDHGCKAWRLSRPQLIGKSRAIYVARPRQVLMWFAIHEYGQSLSHVARCMDRDHTTVLHGTRKVQKLLSTDPFTYDLWKAFEEDMPPFGLVTVPPPIATIVSIQSVVFTEMEMPAPVETTQEVTLDAAIIDASPVIDEAAMMRRRMAGR